MILFKEAAKVAAYTKEMKQQGAVIGFVPTMGALHRGHISLIEKSKSLGDLTVGSIFVNPTQFNDPKDFEKYPVTISNDLMLLQEVGCDVLFMPPVSEMYPNGNTAANRYAVGEAEFILEGKYRPDHFQGVCQAVHRLLNITSPDHLFLGQKDYQQCIIVKRLLQLIGSAAQLITVGTCREPSGLAMSSRNLRLTQMEKIQAAGIYKMLQYIKEHYRNTPFLELENFATNYLLANGCNKVDYVSIADGSDLQPAQQLQEGQKLVALIAAYVGDVILIDNEVLNDSIL
jgi:pantoate--beta-alanine ligase